MTRLIHTMVRVKDLATSIAFYRSALELEVKDQFVFDNFTLTYLSNRETEFELELTYNHDTEEAYHHGNGYGHIAVSVDDIHQTHHKLNALGLDPSEMKTIQHQNIDLATLFFITDPDGYKIEFLQRQGRYQ